MKEVKLCIFFKCTKNITPKTLWHVLYGLMQIKTTVLQKSGKAES